LAAAANTGSRGGAGDFPDTRHSIVEAVRAPEPGVRERALEALISSYWKPVYKYLRLRWRVPKEEAEDLTQGFFLFVLERGEAGDDRGVLERFDPGRARFRTWIRRCLDGYVANQKKAAARIKRGGDVAHMSLDFETAEGELARRDVAVDPRAAADSDPEALFHREWLRSLLALAVEDLRRISETAGRDIDFAIFERYDLEGSEDHDRPTYTGLARELGVPVTKVTNALHAQRRRFREAALTRLREICASDAEFRAEARSLFGTESS